MDEPDRRTVLFVAGLLIGGTILAAMLLGGQTPKILSTVGSAVGGSVIGGGGSGVSDEQAGDDPSTGGATGGKVAGAAPIPPPTLLIVRTGTIELEITDLVSAIRTADAAVARSGGYVDGSNRTADGGAAEATVAYRIPSAAWDATLDAIRGLATAIRSEQIKTEEVSGQVVDLGARIVNLRSSEAAFQAIMAKATKIADVLDVQEQLTATRGEIERLVADKAHLEDRASYGSLTVTFQLPPRPEPTATPVPKQGWDPGSDVERATGKLVRIGQGATSLGIWLTIVGLPLLIGGLVLAFATWQLYRLGRWLFNRRGPAVDPAG